MSVAFVFGGDRNLRASMLATPINREHATNVGVGNSQLLANNDKQL
jgi:hypothetical protein